MKYKKLFLGILFLAMLAGGNEETVTKAKQNILNGALGLVVIIFSYAITAIIFNIILNRD